MRQGEGKEHASWRIVDVCGTVLRGEYRDGGWQNRPMLPSLLLVASCVEVMGQVRASGRFNSVSRFF